MAPSAGQGWSYCKDVQITLNRWNRVSRCSTCPRRRHFDALPVLGDIWDLHFWILRSTKPLMGEFQRSCNISQKVFEKWENPYISSKKCEKSNISHNVRENPRKGFLNGNLIFQLDFHLWIDVTPSIFGAGWAVGTWVDVLQVKDTIFVTRTDVTTPPGARRCVSLNFNGNS